MPCHTEADANLGPVELVIPHDIALLLVHRTCGPRGHVDDGVSFKSRGIIEKAIPLNPMPTVHVPAKSGHFAIEEDDFFLFLAFGSMNNFNLVEETNHIPRGIFPFP